LNLNGSSTTAGVTYSWVASNGGHIVSGATNPNPLIDQPGTYTLTVTNPVNGCTATDVALVTQDVNVPNVNAGADAVLTCLISQLNLNGSSTTAGVTYSWVASNGGHIVSGATNPNPLIDQPGTYTLTVTNPVNGCTATDVALVTQNVTPPNVNAGVDSTLTCLVEEIVVGGSSTTAGVTYSWVAQNGGNIVSGADTATPTVDAAGRYILTVTNPVNGCVAADTVDIAQDIEPPTCSLECPSTPVLCGSTGNTMTATYEDAVDFAWTLAGSGWIITAGDDTDTITYTAGSGTGSFKLIVTAANGCVDSCMVDCECQSGEQFCSYTQGGWGSGCPDSQAGDMMSTQPGCIRDHYFDDVFPDGVMIGLADGYYAKWTTAVAVENFLPAGKTPMALTGNLTNPTKTPAGVLAGQILALRLNVAYSAAGVFFTLGLQDEVSPYANYVIPDSCGSRFAGMTVGEFLAIADSVVAGRSSPYKASHINETATCLNEAWDNCGRDDYDVYGEGIDPWLANDANRVPTTFSLGQAYPNPFNPSCEIRFGLPRDSRVQLVIYNLLGQAVRVLVDDQLSAGFKTVIWDGKDNSGRMATSGVYIYRIKAGDFVENRKMVLLK
jgi:hypothetical protein